MGARLELQPRPAPPPSAAKDAAVSAREAQALLTMFPRSTTSRPWLDRILHWFWNRQSM